MKKLTPPNFHAVAVYRQLIQRTKKHVSFVAVANDIDIADQVYQQFAINGQYWQMSSCSQIESSPDHIEQSDMANLYSNHLVGRHGRHIYDQLLQCPHNQCPYCNQRVVSSLDHILPKSRYINLAVNPHNLVPSCSDCNKDKGDFDPQSAAEQFLHPYFDDIGHSRWLFAQIIEEGGGAVTFNTQENPGIDAVLNDRIAHQFEKLKLAELYASNGGRELANIYMRNEDIFVKDGSAALQDQLRGECESRLANDPNSWQSALYEALARNNWYCNGGFISQSI